MDKQMIRKRLLVATISLYVFQFANAVANETATDQQLKRMEVLAITSLCTNEKYLNGTKLSKEKCISLLTDNAQECRELVRPFVPNIEKKEDAFLLRNIGVLFTYCVEVVGYEQQP